MSLWEVLSIVFAGGLLGAGIVVLTAIVKARNAERDARVYREDQSWEEDNAGGR